MLKLAKLRGLPWDVILTSEPAQAVKPDPMVACRKAYLRGAMAAGFRTAFVARPLEAGPNGQVDTKPEADFDLNATSFAQLADLLQA